MHHACNFVKSVIHDGFVRNMQLVFSGGQRPIYIHVQVWRIYRKPLIQMGKYTIHNIALTPPLKLIGGSTTLSLERKKL
jgi:hypothetical protein